MKIFFALALGNYFILSVVLGDEETCVDTWNQDCSQYLSYCDSDNVGLWFAAQCQKSCGKCSDGGNGAPCTYGSDCDSGVCKDWRCGCFDSGAACESYKNFGYCTHTHVQYMEEMCRKACGLCTECDAVCGCGFSHTSEGLDGTGKTFTNPGEGIDNCATACRDRDGCTSFEYNHEGDEGFSCGTYTGGSDNIRNSQKTTWTSCILDVGSWTMTEEGKFCRETIAEDFKDSLVGCQAYCEENGAKTLSFNTVANTNYDQYYCRCCTESSELADASCYEHSCNQMYTLLD